MLAGHPERVDGVEHFPSLEAAGLKVGKTIGDGDCLFRALSDQLYGHPDFHLDLRTAVVAYEAEHPEEFKDFVVATRKREQPKRKNAAQFASTGEPPSEKRRQAAWQQHLKNMAQPGTWGGHAELVAFTRVYCVDVKVWHWNQQDWLMQARENAHNGLILHIAFHRFNHYSTVRNADGPDTGLPNIRERETGPRRIIVEIDSWKITEVRQSLYFYVTDEAIEQALVRYAGNTIEATTFLENEYRSSMPSTPGSTSTQRDLDEDDEAEFSGPSKKQDRAGSRNRNRELSNKLKAHRFFQGPSKLSQEESMQSTPGSESSASFDSLIDRLEMPMPRRQVVPTILVDSDDEKFSFEARKIASDTDSSLAPSIPKLKLRLSRTDQDPDDNALKPKKLLSSRHSSTGHRVKLTAKGQLKQRKGIKTQEPDDPPAYGMASIAL